MRKSANFPGAPRSFVTSGPDANHVINLLLGNPPYVTPDNLNSGAHLANRLRADFPELYNKFKKDSLRNGVARLMKIHSERIRELFKNSDAGGM